MQELVASNSGLVFSSDPRDKNFAFSDVVKDKPLIKSKYWWPDGWWGNQRSTPQCVAYSWVHLLEDGPVIQNQIPSRSVPLIEPSTFYNACKQVDGLKPGLDGTTLHAAAKVAMEAGLITEYRWANTIEEVVDALLIFGPVIAATYWYAEMNNASSTKMVVRSGRNLGGHAYILNGVDTVSKTIRIKNSYGKTWGDNGHGLISFNTFSTLLKEGGTVCVPFERKVTSVPQL